jgi:uncharacterized membrane protein
MLPLLFIFLSASAADLPFWKAKEKVYERVKNGEIIVAVKSQSVTEPGVAKNLMVIHGGGHTGAPIDFVYRKATDFERLGQVSGYIKSAKFEADKRELEIVVGAFGFEGKMKLNLQFHPPRKIEFLVASGSMQGMTGVIELTSLTPLKTEVGVEALFRYDQFPAPRVFLEFGLEVVFQRMAARLRAYVEEEYAKQKRAS